ncbi:MAG: EamA family transporter [Cyclobacteriaceae bacterium]
MKPSNTLLFLIPTLIWGSTFYAIKFQVGVVPPLWSVSYRFVLAGILLLAYCRIARINLRYSRRTHLRMIMQGALLFGINYWLVYLAEIELTSGLVAVAFSCLIFTNIIFGTLILKRKTDGKVYVGAALGFMGTVLLFYQDFKGIRFEDLPMDSLIFCGLSVIVASLGNITSAANQSHKIPVVQSNAFGMLYGGILMGIVGFLSGAPVLFITTPEYIGSLIYLAVFGSIIAFGGYLTLIGKIGPDRAAYVLVTFPIIAIGLSVLFEGFIISLLAIVGMVLILGGNLLVLKK